MSVDELVRGARRRASHGVAASWARVGAAVYEPMLSGAERRGMEGRRWLLPASSRRSASPAAGTGPNRPHHQSDGVFARRTLSAIERTFEDVEVDGGTWQGMPTAVRPLVTGRAVQGNQAGRGRAHGARRPGSSSGGRPWNRGDGK